MKKLILTCTLLVILSMHCFGQLRVKAGVKYRVSEYSYSTYYFREIELMTGVELNEATNAESYDAYSDYALIWFDQNQVAIIKLKNKIQSDSKRLMGASINKSLLDVNCQIAGYTKDGVDQDGTEWRLCFYSDDFRSLCN